MKGFESRGVGALQAYLRQAVLNRIRDELRRKGRQPDATDLDGLEIDHAKSPLELAIGQEAVERYERALEQLTPQDREAIIARVEMATATRSSPRHWGSRRPMLHARRRSGRSFGWWRR